MRTLSFAEAPRGESAEKVSAGIKVGNRTFAAERAMHIGHRKGHEGLSVKIQ